MLRSLRPKLNVMVANAANRGNPLAKKLVARELRSVYGSIDVSPIVPGPYHIPDLSVPLPDDDDDPLPLVAVDTSPLCATDLLGKAVSDLSVTLGRCGLNSYQFFGLELGPDWLVVPINDAGRWLHLDGRILEGEGGWIVSGDDTAALARLRGALITSATVGQHSLHITFDNDAALSVQADPKTRPVARATGKPRAFLPDDDLRTAVFLSPTGEIYL